LDEARESNLLNPKKKKMEEEEEEKMKKAFGFFYQIPVSLLVTSAAVANGSVGTVSAEPVTHFSGFVSVSLNGASSAEIRKMCCECGIK
jgi:hypothetical protein